MQETLATTQEKARKRRRRRKNGEEEKDGEKKATEEKNKKEEEEKKEEEKEEKAEGGLKLDACKHEIDLLRETKRRLLQRLQLDVTFTFPDLLIENAVKTTMDEMKDANDTIARAARDQLWDARRKIGVSERLFIALFIDLSERRVLKECHHSTCFLGRSVMCPRAIH